jgi:hypothetical protein
MSPARILARIQARMPDCDGFARCDAREAAVPAPIAVWCEHPDRGSRQFLSMSSSANSGKPHLGLLWNYPEIPAG